MSVLEKYGKYGIWLYTDNNYKMVVIVILNVVYEQYS
jgi:hypothetical protein